jgi:hypothetical protein
MTDATIVNTAQAEAWNGYEGEHWASHADRYDAVNNGFNDYVLDQVGTGRSGTRHRLRQRPADAARGGAGPVRDRGRPVRADARDRAGAGGGGAERDLRAG